MITFSQLGKLGRFGNQLFQIAGVIGIATKSNQNFVFPRFINHDHKDRFGSSEDVELFKFFEHELPRVPPIGFESRYISWGYHDVYLPVGNWDLSGHFQSENYFKHCTDLVRYYLRMKDEYPQNDYTAVHVRLGDYDDKYHPRLNMDYYGEAMKRMNGKFLVFSDDLEAAKNMFGSDVEFYDSDYIDSFKMMKSCKSFITGNSSFSAMAAWLGESNDKQIIMPRKWFGEAWGPVHTTMANDIYFNQAIVI